MATALLCYRQPNFQSQCWSFLCRRASAGHKNSSLPSLQVGSQWTLPISVCANPTVKPHQWMNLFETDLGSQIKTVILLLKGQPLQNPWLPRPHFSTYGMRYAIQRRKKEIGDVCSQLKTCCSVQIAMYFVHFCEIWGFLWPLPHQSASLCKYCYWELLSLQHGWWRRTFKGSNALLETHLELELCSQPGEHVSDPGWSRGRAFSPCSMVGEDISRIKGRKQV